MAVRALLFDAFGTLFTYSSLSRAYRALGALVRERLGVDVDPAGFERAYSRVLDELWSRGRPSFVDGLVELLSRMGVSLDRREAEALVLAAVPRSLDVYPDVPEALTVASAAFEGLGVVSDGDSSVVEEALKALGLREYFSVVVGSLEVGEAKPSPKPLLRALEALSTPPREAGMVGDSWKDVAAARAAGLAYAGLVVRRPTRLRAEAPDAVACDLVSAVRLSSLY